MKHIYFFIAIIFVYQSPAQEIPTAREVPLTIEKHNIKFADNFAWLEDLDSDEVVKWVAAQNQAADAHLELVRKTHSSEFKIKEYRYLTSNGLPAKKGKFYYSRITTGPKTPMSLFYRKSLKELPIELVSLSRIYKNNPNATIRGYYPSPTSETLAYKVSLDGSDRQEVRFVKFAGVKNLPDVLKDVKFSNIEWNGDDGIFYTRNSNVRRFDRDSTFHVYYHKIGTAQESDKLILDASKIDGSVGFFTEGRKLIFEVSNGEETEQTFSYIDLNDASLQIKPLFKDSIGIGIKTVRNGRIYYSTPESDWGDLRSMDFSAQKDVKVVIPQIYMNLLTATDFIDDYIICHYKAIGKNFINIHDKDGKFIRKFEAVSGMDIDVKFIDPETKDLYVSFYSYTIPFHNYTLNINTGERKPYISNIMNHKPQLFPTGYFVTGIFHTKAATMKTFRSRSFIKKTLCLTEAIRRC